ncbi:hypothetical protein JCM5353_007842 [Sporobolomyces roseus]
MSGNNSSEPQQRLTPPRAPGDPPSPTESELGSNSSVSNPQRSTQPSNPPSAPPSSNFFSDWQLFRAPEPTSYGSETTTEGEESQTAEESLPGGTRPREQGVSTKLAKPETKEAVKGSRLE